MSDKAQKSPYGVAVWVCISIILHIFLFKRNMNNDYQVIQRGLMGLVAIVFTLSMHELIHFTFLKIFCKGKVKIELGKDPIGLPSLRTVYQEEIANWQKIVTYLAPFVF